MIITHFPKMGLSHLIHFKRIIPINRKNINLLHKPFSSTSPNPKPASLSARMSFVFDQIDAIEKERSEKDQTLQRIRTWRESKKLKQPTTEIVQNEQNVVECVEKSDNVAVSGFKEKGLLGKSEGVELVHPWVEWIELIERLVYQNYFDIRRKDEGKMLVESGLGGGGGIMEEVMEEGFDFTRDWKTVLMAGLNFGKDRFDILRSLARKDIQLLVGYGCPTTDKKVVFSSKLLRKHVHLDEGDVCSSCSLRSSCERAYLVTNKEDEARTIDIMRVLLTYGFDSIRGLVVNDSLLKKKPVKAAVRKLLHEVVKLSAFPIDPNLPPPIIKRPPPKVKQTPPPPKRRVGRDDVEMKKGDWLCPKCDFMNFAKNTVCLQCDAKRPKRQLLPGEWECPECQFLNYRRNMACFHCECKRPQDEFTENQMQERQFGQQSKLDNVPSRKEVSDAWNFDFDENESDGAEVAAFEYADSRKLDQEFPSSRQRDEEIMSRFDNYQNKRPIGPQETEYSGFGAKPGVGFDDFDDEEDDDVNSYELDTKPSTSSVNFSDIDVDSESEDEIRNARGPVSSQRNKRASKSSRGAFSDDGVDFNSDDDLPVHPNWKSSHVADSRQKSRGRMRTNYGSDEDSDLDSDDDDFPPKRKVKEYRKVKDDFLDDDDRFSRDRPRGKKTFPDRRNSPVKGFKGNFDGRRKDSYEGGSRDFKSHRRENFSDRHNQRPNMPRGSLGSGAGAGAADSDLDHERFSRPRVNVR